MIEKKVFNKAFGIGVIVEFKNEIATVKFSEVTKNFRYPDAFSGYLTLLDGVEQLRVESLANEAIAEKKKEQLMREIKKSEENRRLYQRYVAENHKKHKLTKAELKCKNEGNLAFKNNYCDGGATEISIGFKGICSPEQILANAKQGRTWCASPDSPCGKFYRGEITYDDLVAIYNDGFVCYEAKLLVDWKSEAGDDVSDDGTHKTRRITSAKRNSLAVLTTVLPGSRDRIIFGVYITGVVDEGDDLDSGYVMADPSYKIELTTEEAKKLPFWSYHKNSDGGTRWGQGLYRYLSNDSCKRILEDIVALKCGDEKKHAKAVLDHYITLKDL